MECTLIKSAVGQQVVLSADTTTIASHVLVGDTYLGYDTNNAVGKGTMANNGAISKTITPSTSAQTYKVPAGYHNGNGVVTVNAVSLSGNAAASEVLSTKTFYNGSLTKQTGSMPNRGAWTATPTGSGNTVIPAGYHNGSGYVNTTTVYNNGVASGKNHAYTYDSSYTYGIHTSGAEVRTYTLSSSYKYLVVAMATLKRKNVGHSAAATASCSAGGSISQIVSGQTVSPNAGWYMSLAAWKITNATSITVNSAYNTGDEMVGATLILRWN